MRTSWALACTLGACAPDSSVRPIYVIAVQSNAEGNVRLTGLQAIEAVLDSNDPAELREGYRAGIGDWCDASADYSDEVADTAVSTLLSGGLRLSDAAANIAITDTEIAAFRWRNQEPSAALGEAYADPASDAHPGHLTSIEPLGPGFGLWDNDDPDVLFYGPELGFGLHVRQQTEAGAFSVLKVAMGGSSLAEHWAPEAPLTAALHEQTTSHLAAYPTASWPASSGSRTLTTSSMRTPSATTRPTWPRC